MAAACKSSTDLSVTPTLAAAGVSSASPQPQASPRVGAAALPALQATAPSKRRDDAPQRGYQSSNWAETFREFFEKHPDSSALNLSGSNIDDAGFAALIDCLKERTKNSLHKLLSRMGTNRALIDECLSAHLEGSHDLFVQKLLQIHELAGDSQELQILIKRCQGLVKLNLSRCNVELRRGLADFPMLQDLDLSYCGRIVFSRNMWPNYLRRVNLEGCHGSQLSLGLPSLIQRCSGLWYLNLNCINELVIHDDVLSDIFRLPHLRRLELRGVFRNVPPRMANWIQESPNLQEVVYDGTRTMTRQEASGLVRAPAAVVAPPAPLPPPRTTRCQRFTQVVALAALGICIDWALPVVAVASVYLSRRFWRA